MKKILLSLVVIVAVAAIAGGATYSYFSDTSVSSDNTFTAGTLDIALDDNGILPLEEGSPIFTDTSFLNMYPGFEGEATHTFVANKGTLPFNWEFYLDMTSDTPGALGGNLFNVLKVKIEADMTGGVLRQWDYPAGTSFDCTTAGVDGYTVIYNGFVADGTYPDAMGNLLAGKGVCFRFTPYLDANLVNVNEVDVDDNRFQGSSATYDLMVKAYQENDPAYVD